MDGASAGAHDSDPCLAVSHDAVAGRQRRFLLDRRPALPVCHPLRHGRVRLLREAGAYWGKTSQGWFFGFQLHVLRQSNEALEASEARFRSIFEQGGLGMATASPEGRYIDVNPAFCRCFAESTSCVSGGPASLNCEKPMLPWNTSDGESMCVIEITPDGVIAV